MPDKNANIWHRVPKSSKYKYVTKVITSGGRVKWEMSYGGKGIYKDTEHQAAKMVDILRIKDGKEPVNVLKRVK